MPPGKGAHTLTYDLGQRGKTPLYQYLYQRIRDDILSGAIAAHEQLPSKRALAAHLHVSVITVENAYRLLQIEGYVYTREKAGHFASELPQRPSGLPAGGTANGAPRRIEPDPPDSVYFADFSSNKVQTSLFPVSTMARITREMIALQDPSFLGTIPYNGTPLFRRAIASHLRRYRGMDVDPEQIVVGCGTEYLYDRLMQILPDRPVLGLEDPGNHKFAKIAGRNRIRTEYVPVGADGVSLASLSQSGVSVLHLSPANSFPLGSFMPISRRFDVLSWLYHGRDRYLIEDDFDSEINSFGGVALPVFHYDARGRTIYMNTFAKTLLPSLRVAYMVLPAELLERYRETTTFYSCTVSGSDQYIFSRFMDDGHFERHLNHLNAFYRSERKLVLDEMARVGLDRVGRVGVPRAGTHVTLELASGAPPREELLERAQEQDICFAMLSDYAARPTELMRRCIVLNYASVPPERVHEALVRLRRCVEPDAE